MKKVKVAVKEKLRPKGAIGIAMLARKMKKRCLIKAHGKTVDAASELYLLALKMEGEEVTIACDDDESVAEIVKILGGEVIESEDASEHEKVV